MAGLEVEAVEQVGDEIRGVIVGEGLTIEELTESKKPIRYCRVAVSDAELTAYPETVTGVICGAVDFKVGDRVAFATGGRSCRRFRDHRPRSSGGISEGMTCAVDELGIGEDDSGILILPPDPPSGRLRRVRRAARRRARHHRDPDRGYAVSIRGVVRELATAYQVP